MKVIESFYPNFLNNLADELCVVRSKLSKNVYTGNKDRGDREVEISRLGILAELIARQQCDEKNLYAKFTPMIDLNPLPEPDLYLNNKSYDIKGVRYDDNCLRINADAFENPDKKCDYYWFIVPEIEYVKSYIVSRDEVLNEWKKVKSKYTDVYIHRIN